MCRHYYLAVRLIDPISKSLVEYRQPNSIHRSMYNSILSSYIRSSTLQMKVNAVSLGFCCTLSSAQESLKKPYYNRLKLDRAQTSCLVSKGTNGWINIIIWKFLLLLFLLLPVMISVTNIRTAFSCTVYMTKKGFLQLTPSPSTNYKIYHPVKGNNQLGELGLLTNWT